MTTILYDEKNLTLELNGHANAGRFGQDIVCAGISVLTFTLLENLAKYEDMGWFTWQHETETPGHIYLHVTANGYYSMINEMFRFVMTGYEMIRDEYPEHVRIIRQEE